MQEFHRRLVGSGVECFAAQPGIAQTGLFSKIYPEASKPIGSLMVLSTSQFPRLFDMFRCALLALSLTEGM